MLSLLAAALLLQIPSAQGPIFSAPSRSAPAQATPFPPAALPFQFAVTGGAGMRSECECVDVSGAQREVATFARTSTGTCVKVSGALVTCPAGAPRVQTVGGLLGILIEIGSTNTALRSEELDDSTWAKTGVVVAAPVVTADQAVAPDGTTTADQIDIAATTINTNASILTQDFTADTGRWTATEWMKTSTGTATIYFGFWDGASSYKTQTCSLTTTWARCKLSYQVLTAATWKVFAGVDLRDAGQSAQVAKTVYAWGAQVEGNGANVNGSTSYIRTAGTTVTRAGESVSFANPLSVLLGSAPTQFCIRTTMIPNDSIWTTGQARYLVYSSSATGSTTKNTWYSRVMVTQGMESLVYNPATQPAGLWRNASESSGVHTFITTYNGTMQDGGIKVDGSSIGTSFGGAGTGIVETQPANIWIGSDGTTSNRSNGTLANVVIDNTTTGCN